MKIVNVLGDDRRHLTGTVERGERPMTATRLCGGKGGFHGKAPPPGLIASFRACDKLVKGNWPVAGPYSAWRTKIRDATLCGDPGARKRNDDRRSGNHVAQPFHGAADVRGNDCYIGGLHYRSLSSILGKITLALYTAAPTRPSKIVETCAVHAALQPLHPIRAPIWAANEVERESRQRRIGMTEKMNMTER